MLDIETVMPHRGAMRLVDRVLEHDAEAISVEARVRADGPFHVDGGLPAYVGVELMAQAIACWAGVRARAQGLAPPVGFLLGTRRYEAHVQVFGIGEVLRDRAPRADGRQRPGGFFLHTGARRAAGERACLGVRAAGCRRVSGTGCPGMVTE